MHMKELCTAVCVAIVATSCGGSSGGSSPSPMAPTTVSTSAASSDGVARVTQADLTRAPDLTPKLIPAGDPLFGLFEKYIKVFGISVLAFSGYPDAMLVQVAPTTAEYLDNNEDGVPDNLTVNSQMMRNGASFVLHTSTATNQEPPQWTAVKDRRELAYIEHTTMMAAEANRGGTVCGTPCGELNDTSLEHVPELFQKAGYMEAYPRDFMDARGSTLADAMDTARGGYFRTSPSSYPDSAWFTITDPYPYDAQIIEYFYWGLVANLGMLGDRSPRVCADIEAEWTLCTRSQFRSTDTGLYAMLTDPRFILPTVAPDGSYRLRCEGRG